LSRPRAVIVATGSELVRGEITDRNGPFLAREALRLGLEPTRVVVVGDDPAELEAALRESLAADACLVSGGLGPTHDDRTVELVARVAGVPLRVDEELRSEIEAFSRGIAERLRRDYEEFAPGVAKQATIPDGATVIGLAGTAPGLVLEAAGTVVVVLPGPPPELQRLWPAAISSEPFTRLLERAHPPARRVLRFFGASESAVAGALAAAGGERAGVEVTICARDFEIHVDLVVEPGADAAADELEARLVAPLEEWLFARDDHPVEFHVLELCRARGVTLATAESCTGGLVAERLTRVPGSSDVFLGAVVAYANEIKERELGVPAETLAAHGAVSPETAAAMAEGARARLGADVAVSVTGVAGPGGGTPEKPVGLVFLHAVSPDASRSQRVELPGDREAVRQRAAALALQLVRRLLTAR
jgi:nicotinamide-nucleotide amidase